MNRNCHAYRVRRSEHLARPILSMIIAMDCKMFERSTVKIISMQCAHFVQTQTLRRMRSWKCTNDSACSVIHLEFVRFLCWDFLIFMAAYMNCINAIFLQQLSIGLLCLHKILWFHIFNTDVFYSVPDDLCLRECQMQASYHAQANLYGFFAPPCMYCGLLQHNRNRSAVAHNAPFHGDRFVHVAEDF